MKEAKYLMNYVKKYYYHYEKEKGKKSKKEKNV